jgi:hypothetical protein
MHTAAPDAMKPQFMGMAAKRRKEHKAPGLEALCAFCASSRPSESPRSTMLIASPTGLA